MWYFGPSSTCKCCLAHNCFILRLFTIITYTTQANRSNSTGPPLTTTHQLFGCTVPLAAATCTTSILRHDRARRANCSRMPRHRGREGTSWLSSWGFRDQALKWCTRRHVLSRGADTTYAYRLAACQVGLVEQMRAVMHWGTLVLNIGHGGGRLR